MLSRKKCQYNEDSMQLEDATGYPQNEFLLAEFQSAKPMTVPVVPVDADTMNTAISTANATTLAAIGTTVPLMGGKLRGNTGAANSGTAITLGRPDTSANNGYVELSSTSTTTYFQVRGGTGGNVNQAFQIETPGTGTIRMHNTGVVDINSLKNNFIRVAGGDTTQPPTITATGGDTNVDLQLIPKGLGNVITNWGTCRLYTASYQNLNALTVTKVTLQTAASNTFVSGACSTLSDQFTNTSGRTGTYLVTYSTGCVIPTAYMALQTWITQTGTTHLIGQNNVTAGGSTGTNGIVCGGSGVVRLNHNESVWISTYAGTACQISYTTTASWACTQVTVTQIG